MPRCETRPPGTGGGFSFAPHMTEIPERPFLPPEAWADHRTIAAAAAEAIAVARKGDARRGLALALHARQQALGLESEAGELAALNAAAIVHAIRGDHMAAVAAGIDAHDLAVKHGDRRILAHTLVTMSSAAFALGALSGARAALERSIVLGLEAGDRDVEFRARIALGVALGDLGEFDGAATEFTCALHLVREHRDSTSAARIVANLANVHLKRASRLFAEADGIGALRECAEAEQVARRALSLATDEANLPVQVDALGIRGRAKELQGDRAGGLALLGDAARLAREARFRQPLPWLLCEGARLALASGDVRSARDAYQEALEVATELRPSTRIEDACLGLAEVSARMGDTLGARRWRERAATESQDFDRQRRQTRAQVNAFFKAG